MTGSEVAIVAIRLANLSLSDVKEVYGMAPTARSKIPSREAYIEQKHKLALRDPVSWLCSLDSSGLDRFAELCTRKGR